jgi:DNA-binding NarL/FixJ family response regulator
MPHAFLLIEDHALVRSGLACLLRELEPAGAVEECGRLAPALLLLARRPAFDLVVYDWGLPDGGGHDGLLAVLESSPGSSVVVLSGTAESSVEWTALRVGAAAYVSKSDDLRSLRFTLAQVLRRRVAAPGGTRGNREEGPGAEARSRLTGRQGQVLRLIEAGLTNREIADTLGIARTTARDHVSEVLAVLGVPNRAAAAGAAGAWARAADAAPASREALASREARGS